MDRAEILKYLTEEQQKTVDTLKETVAQFVNASDLDETENRDIDDLSHQDEATDMKLRYEALLAEAENNLVSLNSEYNQAGEIGRGSIVVLDGLVVFIGYSVPKFSAGKTKILGISEDAPVFENFNGKKEGDKVKMGENSYTIQQIL